MAPEETNSAGLSRLHLMEAIIHLDFVVEHMTNLCNDEACEDLRGEIRQTQNTLDMLHSQLIEETDEQYNFDSWSGLEAFSERARDIMGSWGAYQFSEWKQSGKVPTNG